MEEAIIKLLGAVSGCAGVKDISGNQKSIDVFLFDGIAQPVQKLAELIIPFSAVKRATQVPVRGVEDFH